MARTQYVLYADVQLTDSGTYGWQFVLESLDGAQVIEATDVEPGAKSERLELLAVLRGLEAIDSPSAVFLLTPSRYVTRGLRFGLDSWRASHWHWERFGHMVPVKNADLWERIDRALTYHDVRCRRATMRRIDRETEPVARQSA